MYFKNLLAGLLAAAFIVVSFTGCPDRSYMRPVPDYKNMTDSGEGEGGQEDGEEDSRGE